MSRLQSDECCFDPGSFELLCPCLLGTCFIKKPIHAHSL
jgi:hypothetical protein